MKACLIRPQISTATHSLVTLLQRDPLLLTQCMTWAESWCVCRCWDRRQEGCLDTSLWAESSQSMGCHQASVQCPAAFVCGGMKGRWILSERSRKKSGDSTSGERRKLGAEVNTELRRKGDVAAGQGRAQRCQKTKLTPFCQAEQSTAVAAVQRLMYKRCTNNPEGAAWS